MADIFNSMIDALSDLLGQGIYVLPEIILMVAAVLSPLLYFITKKGTASAVLTFVLMAVSAVVTCIMMHTVTYGTAFGLFEFDAFSSLMMLLFLAVGGLTVFISQGHVETTKHKGEYYALIAGAVAAMMFVASATNLVAIFVGVEVVSIFSYALVALKKNDPRSSEAAVK